MDEVYFLGCQDELALAMERRCGLSEELASQLASAVSCGQTVEFIVKTEVSLPQRVGGDLVMVQNSTTWRAAADETWELRKVEV